LTVPDAPINFANDAALTTSTQIGLTWDEASVNGGTIVFDYQLSLYDSDSDTYSVVQSSIATTSYTITGLTAGTTYIITVQAQNSEGYSDYSE
jgi:hypothetical protein